jgi:hypothetical protein
LTLNEVLDKGQTWDSEEENSGIYLTLTLRHYSTNDCSTLHAVLHYTTLHYTTLHYTTRCYTLLLPVSHNTQHNTTQHNTTQHTNKHNTQDQNSILKMKMHTVADWNVTWMRHTANSNNAAKSKTEGVCMFMSNILLFVHYKFICHYVFVFIPLNFLCFWFICIYL